MYGIRIAMSYTHCICCAVMKKIIMEVPEACWIRIVVDRWQQSHRKMVSRSPYVLCVGYWLAGNMCCRYRDDNLFSFTWTTMMVSVGVYWSCWCIDFIWWIRTVECDGRAIGWTLLIGFLNTYSKWKLCGVTRWLLKVCEWTWRKLMNKLKIAVLHTNCW